MEDTLEPPLANLSFEHECGEKNTPFYQIIVRFTAVKSLFILRLAFSARAQRIAVALELIGHKAKMKFCQVILSHTLILNFQPPKVVKALACKFNGA